MTLRHKYPHLRCGRCDEEFAPGEATVYEDDERCHRDRATCEALLDRRLDELDGYPEEEAA